MNYPDDFVNKIIQGDCLEVMKQMPDKSVDLVLTDPPYDFSEEMKRAIHQELLRVARGAIVFSPPENQWLSADQYAFWVKPMSTKNTSKRYSRFVEMIFFYGDLKWKPGRHWSQYTNVFMDLVDGDTEHPYEKPSSLIKRLLLNHSSKDDSILDPFLGSGTTAVAAKQLHRNSIGIEISSHYCQMARDRLRQEVLF